MTVRPASELPWQTYRDVRLRALSTDSEAFGSSYARESQFSEQRWAERAANPGTLLWVADDEPAASRAVAPRADGIAGLVRASSYLDDADSAVAISDERQTLAFVVQVWVEPARRGSGVFDELMARLIALAPEQGYRTLALHVHRVNERAAGAYSRHGFVKLEHPSPACPSDEDEYVLRLPG